MNSIIGALATVGFFTGSITMIAWNRVPAWKNMPDAQFKEDFAETIRIADKLQPTLLVVTLALTLWFVFTAHGIAQVLAFTAILAQAIILIASLIVLVPLQNRLIAAYRDKTVNTETLRAMRERWCKGHIGRTVLSVIMFLLVVATAFAANI